MTEAAEAGAATMSRASPSAATPSTPRRASTRGRTTTSPSPASTTDAGAAQPQPALDARQPGGHPAAPRADFNRSDGFSPGNLIATKVPGLDTQAELRRHRRRANHRGRGVAELDQPIVVINADTGERHLIFSEIDANPSDPENRALIIRPAENFEEGERYIVALRNLQDASGPIAPDPVFEDYRDGTPTRRAGARGPARHMEQLFNELEEAAGIPTRATTSTSPGTSPSPASQNLSERALYMRDDAFAQLGDTDLSDLQVPGASEAPSFTVDTVTTDAGRPRDRPRRRGHLRRPVLPQPPRLPAGLDSSSSSRAPTCRRRSRATR